MSTTQPPTTYQAEVSALDIALDWKLAELRAALDRLEITPAEAATMRVAYLEDHLSRVRQARIDHYGPEESTDA